MMSGENAPALRCGGDGSAANVSPNLLKEARTVNDKSNQHGSETVSRRSFVERTGMGLAARAVAGSLPIPVPGVTKAW